MRIANSKMIGDHNKLEIMELIKRSPISRAEISKILKISKPAVTKNVNVLMSVGLIKEGKTDDSPMGRKALLLEYNYTFAYILGINIGSKNLQINLADLGGNIIDMEISKIKNNENAEDVYNQIVDSMKSVINKKNLKLQNILSVAISSPGIRNPETGGYEFNPFIKNWDKLDLPKLLKNDLNLDCVVFNDVDMSIMGERLKGIGVNYNNLAYLKLWDGFAARLIINGQIYRGINNAAGEIGFMMLGENYIQDKSDETGYLEKLISNEGVSNLYKELSISNGVDSAEDKELTIKSIVELANKKDLIAIKVLKKLTKYLVMVIINIVVVVNPEIVILGGDLTNVNDAFMDNIHEILSNNFPYKINVVRGSLGENSEIVGCIFVALKEANEKLKLLW